MYEHITPALVLGIYQMEYIQTTLKCYMDMG